MPQQEETMNVREVVITLRKRFWMIVLITLLFVAVSAGITYLVMTPVYQAKSELLVNKSQEGSKTGTISRNDIESNLQLIETYNVVMKSPRVMDKVAQKMGQPDRVSALTSQISVSAVKDSQVISIEAKDPDKQRAAMLVNTVAQTFQEEITNIMKVDNVQILTKAKADTNGGPVQPKPIVNMAVAFVIGLIFSMALAFLLEYLDNTLKTEEDIEKHLGLPVIGSIAVIEASDKAGVRKLEERKAQVAAAGEHS
ncbi:YveK family protein [Aneurinibacillus danicus]|uniref:Capsular polysaccharide biosynthesis protein n=1 Tax=Aneurinibacillus danicus TaxID=267746 RepID=A0A511VB17_9BACL|nr:Wzz/FepE/Etk N-terminal domain-containing protein [Aneurinibacillus danicus]GEN36014.1 capsular polysaccharide biosynthesis protein [Aneurinibacillus danicus]